MSGSQLRMPSRFAIDICQNLITHKSMKSCFVRSGNLEVWIATATQVMIELVDQLQNHVLQVEDVERAAARAVDEQSRQMEQAMAHEQALAEVTVSRQQAQQRAEAQVQASNALRWMLLSPLAMGKKSITCDDIAAEECCIQCEWHQK